jgi:hypothetical protein
MSSNINPNNIDGAYPVAGQDNNSQGFRDNFTNTKTNFQFAADEISQLQSYAVLKAALTGTVLDNNMNGSVLSNAQLQDMSLTRVALGTLSGSVGINYSAGHYQTVTTAGSISLAFTNFSAAGTLSFVTVRVTVASTAHTMTLPAAVGNASASTSILGIEGIASNIITFAETGTYEFQFHTDDGGNTVYLSELTRPRNYFTNRITVAGGITVTNGGVTVTDGAIVLNGSEDLAASAAASLTKIASYFTTAAAETATLAAGTNGQIKTFAMYGDGGDMVITVTNAGWKSSGTGTITFNTIGQACTLQYINSKWFCVGNNGTVFA